MEEVGLHPDRDSDSSLLPYTPAPIPPWASGRPGTENGLTGGTLPKPIALTILTMFKGAVAWHDVHSLCWGTIPSTHPQNSFHLTKRKLCPQSPPTTPGCCHPAFCLDGFDYLKVPGTGAIIRCLSL